MLGRFANEFILATSSTISTSPCTSGLQAGTIISNFLATSFTKKPSELSISSCLLLLTSIPINCFTFFGSKIIFFLSDGTDPAIITSDASPPHKSIIIFVAIFDPDKVKFGSIPLSKRYLASEFI